MFQNKKLYLVFGLLMVASFVLAACQPAAAPEVETIVETVVVTEVIEGETVEVVVTATPAPVEEVPPEPRTLVVCIAQEPDSLYWYGGSMLAGRHVQQAIYDGPYDNNSFGYQAIILEKLPSLADGDAVFQAVEVAPGDTIADADQNPVALEAGVVYRPSGCSSSDCAVTYAEGDGNVTMDQLVVTHKFLPGLLWSDGTPLTAADSVYSFNLVADPDTPASKYTIDRTASYEALDDVTTQWTGLPGYVDSTYFLNVWFPMPEHVWGAFTAAELLTAEESSRIPLGWGPYVLNEWTAGESITATKNENYYRADEGLPKFDNAVFRFVGEESNANVAKILSGECDIVDQSSGLEDQSELLLELQAAGQLNATFVTGTVWEHADYGVVPVCADDGDWSDCPRGDIFGDVLTRRAMLHCMDRQAAIDTVYYGQSTTLNTYVAPLHPLYNADAAAYDYNVEGGSALLEEAGWVLGDDGVRVYAGDNPNIAQGSRLSVNYWTTTATARQQATQIFQATMAECGIEVLLEYWSAGEYFADGPEGPLFGRYFDIGQFAWLTGVEPSCDLYITDQIPDEVRGWGSANNAGWSNAEYDAACKAALSSLPGQAAYDENHLLAQEIFADQLPVAPLYLRIKLAATRPDMCNFIMDPTENSEIFNIEEFDYGESCSG